ncbi:hypothetical protein GGI17_001953 [Coemansia sp. S146]|nr:hypothetical protein GGI17_001953 [Coemansia sp. S146]
MSVVPASTYTTQASAPKRAADETSSTCKKSYNSLVENVVVIDAQHKSLTGVVAINPKRERRTRYEFGYTHKKRGVCLCDKGMNTFHDVINIGRRPQFVCVKSQFPSWNRSKGRYPSFAAYRTNLPQYSMLTKRNEPGPLGASRGRVVRTVAGNDATSSERPAGQCSPGWYAPGWLPAGWSSPDRHPVDWHPDGHADAQHEDTVDRLADMLDRLMQNEATALAPDPILNQEIEDLVSRLDRLSQQDASPVIDPATPVARPDDANAIGSLGEQQNNPSTIQYWIQERCRRQGNAEISTRGIGIKIMFIRLVTDVMRDTIIEDGSNELETLADRSDEEIIRLHRQKYPLGKVGYIKLPGEHTPGDGQAPDGTCDGYDEDVVEIVEQGRIPRRQQ